MLNFWSKVSYSYNKISAIFNHISAPRKKLKIWFVTFVRSLFAKLKPSSFKTEGRDRG